MKFSSPRVIFVPYNLPDQRQGMLKFRRDMENMPEDSDDIFMKEYIDRYPQRRKARFFEGHLLLATKNLLHLVRNVLT